MLVCLFHMDVLCKLTFLIKTIGLYQLVLIELIILNPNIN